MILPLLPPNGLALSCGADNYRNATNEMSSCYQPNYIFPTNERLKSKLHIQNPPSAMTNVLTLIPSA